MAGAITLKPASAIAEMHKTPSSKLRDLFIQVRLMATLQQIHKQIEQLQKEAETLRKKEGAEVLARIREAIAVYQFTVADLGFGSASAGRRAGHRRNATAIPGSRQTQKAASARKYGDAQGNTWSGRGPRPAWFKAALEAGKAPEDLLLK